MMLIIEMAFDQYVIDSADDDGDDEDDDTGI